MQQEFFFNWKKLGVYVSCIYILHVYVKHKNWWQTINKLSLDCIMCKNKVQFLAILTFHYLYLSFWWLSDTIPYVLECVTLVVTCKWAWVSFFGNGYSWHPYHEKDRDERESARARVGGVKQCLFLQKRHTETETDIDRQTDRECVCVTGWWNQFCFVCVFVWVFCL